MASGTAARSGPEADASAWALLVVSDSAQANTLPDQEAWARETALANGWLLGPIFAGVSSGKTGTRDLASKMIDELESMSRELRPRRILMIRLERLGRGTGLEAMESFLRIRRLGVIVHTRLDGDVSDSRASDLLMPMFRFFIGSLENEVRIDKLNAHYKKRREGHAADPTVALSNRPAYGLQIINGHYAEKAPESETVRQIYQLKVQGYGAHLIARRIRLTAPPWQLRSGVEKPQKWTTDRVRRLILKPAYRGILIDEATWYSAQRRLREVGRPTIRYEYPMAGSLQCECGYALVGHPGAGRGKGRWRNYHCIHDENHSGHSKSHAVGKIDAQFIALLEKMSADNDLLERYVAGKGHGPDRKVLTSKLAALKSEVGDLDKRRRAVFDAFETGKLKRADLQWRLDDLHTTESALTNSVRTIEEQLAMQSARSTSIADARDLVRRASELWSRAPIDEKHALAKAVSAACGGFVVTSDGRLLVSEKQLNL